MYVDDHQCGQIQFNEGQQAYTFDCGEKEASEVSVRLNNGQSLQVCELEVLGTSFLSSYLLVFGINMGDLSIHA